MADEKKKRAPRGAAKTFEPGSLERFVVKRVHRSKLANAPYNPRTMTDDERARLRAGMEELGLLAPVTWNERTGNLVGGHQRVSVLDACYGTADYELAVAAVDLTDVQEREANLLLNNQQAMGDFDLGKLEAMFKETPAMSIAATGFDAAQLFQLFGDTPFADRSDDQLSEVAKKIREARDRQASTKSAVKAREKTEFYLVVIFADPDDREAFCTSVGWDDTRYQDGRQLRQIAGAWIAARAAAAPPPQASDDDAAAPAIDIRAPGLRQG